MAVNLSINIFGLFSVNIDITKIIKWIKSKINKSNNNVIVTKCYYNFKPNRYRKTSIYGRTVDLVATKSKEHYKCNFTPKHGVYFKTEGMI